MANFSQSVTGVINCLGPQNSTKWGAPMQWGSSTFGNGSSGTFGLSVRVITRTSDTGPVFTDSYSNNIKLEPMVATAAFLQGGVSESLRDGSGRYFLVLAGGVTNDEYAVIASYTAQANAALTWGAYSTSAASWVTQ